MTAPDLPAPLVPAEVDLRDFPYLPIDIARLFGSEFHARSSDAVWRAGVTLWLKSFHQVPAGSVPDDDVAMARLAELGRDLKTWRKIKVEVLRGWIMCSDGRLHHPVVAEKALEAWIEKLVQRKASALGNAKRYGLAFDPTLSDAALHDSLTRLAALNPNSRTLAKRVLRGAVKPDTGTPAEVPSGDGSAPTGSSDASHREAGKVPSGDGSAPTGSSDASHREAGKVPSGDGSAPTGSSDASHREAGKVPSGDGSAPTGIPREEKERKDIPPEPPSGSLPPPGATPRRGTRLDPGWVPDLVDRGYAAEQGLSEGEAAAQAERFRDHWLAEGGPKAWKRDWRAAWRTWCRGAVERRPGAPTLLMPINGGARASPANGTVALRPTSGPASALAGIAAAVNAHREAS